MLIRLVILAMLLTPVTDLLSYVRRNWSELSRSHDDLVAAAYDPKLHTDRFPLYAPPGEKVELTQAQRAKIELRVLPEGGYEAISEHGLLYLPHPYVVPGGRFNEMYGWDSYFINLGLLRDGLVQQAIWMVENHLYQVRHYGAVLNANRTYYLTRSQPPFLARMVLDVYQRTGDKAWLGACQPELRAYYDFWIREPRLVPSTGLSRYYDDGKGPAPEVAAGERDAQGRNHYERLQLAYAERAATWNPEDYPLELYYRDGKLTELFYLGDRAMRESGYDPSDRFGPFNVDVIHYLPVDLNCLLYLYEQDMAAISRELGLASEAWEKRAADRSERILRYCWDPAVGLFLDYNFRTGKRRNYPFGTCFFPLWVGIATPEQASRTAANLPIFERPGGLLTSPHVSGNQWDAPYGWAPLQMVAVEGLRRYGMEEAANRISVKFLSLVLEEFQRIGAIVEKYDVEKRTSDVSLTYGYTSNEIGFGWTNAVWTRLYDALPEAERAKL